MSVLEKMIKKNLIFFLKNLGGSGGGCYARNMDEDVDHFRSREEEEEDRNEGGG